MGEPSESAVRAGALAPDMGPAADPRRTALQELAGLLRGQKYDVEVERLHLTVRDGGRPVEVWVQRRPDDGYRLWFTWPGSIPISEVADTADAVVAVKRALRRVPARET